MISKKLYFLNNLISNKGVKSVEKIVYVEKYREKPVEKIVFVDKYVDVPKRRIVYIDKVKPIEIEKV